MVVRVILDTNFLLVPGQFKVDIFEEFARTLSFPYQLCIFKETIDELSKIAESKKRDASNAKVALKLIKQKNLKSLPNSYTQEGFYIDKIILENITDNDIVCTQDKELKRQLRQKSKKIRILTLKSKKHIVFE